MRLLFDTCVILDYLLKRQPFDEDSYTLIRNMYNNHIYGYISANSISDIYYIVRKSLHDNNETKQIIKKLMDVFNIIDTTKEDCQKALLSDLYDYEDAIMIESAIANDIDCITTRNIQDFLNSPIKVLTPSQLLSSQIISEQ